MSAHYYPDKKADRVAELIQLPREELTTMEEASVAQEKAIFSKFSEIEAEWRKQAAETIAIRKAREYLRALPVEHTSNQWKVNQFGWNVLSNMVYKMSYRVSENKTPDGTLINCTLSWDIHYNTLQHPTPDYTGDGWKIAGQSDKRFATKRSWSVTCKAGSKPTPTCSRRCPRLSQRERKDASPSTASFSPAIRWRLPWKNGWRKCFPFWRTTRPCWRSRCPPAIKTHHKRRSRLWHRSCIPRP